jgi:hypothetical protein
MKFLISEMVQLEHTWTNNTAIPSSNPFMTLVLSPTAGHMLRAKRNMGFSFNRPFKNSCDWVLGCVTMFQFP